jgi:hypothetical protein
MSICAPASNEQSTLIVPGIHNAITFLLYSRLPGRYVNFNIKKARFYKRLDSPVANQATSSHINRAHLQSRWIQASGRVARKARKKQRED